MAASQELDEIQWRAPHLVGVMGGIHENSVLHYFAESPFFDRTSNNATITTQAMINPHMASIIETREAFEAHLRNIPGLEYVVAYGPKDFGGVEAPINEGLFVIRKQERRKRPGQADEIKVLSTYYVVGNAIMMAPSVGDILSARVKSITLAMRNFMKTASGLPSFSPASGYSYLPNRSQLADSLNRAASNAQSRATTPLRDTESLADTAAGTTSASDTQALVESFSNFLRYGNEYSDENPLVGEPRNFVFASSKQHVNAQREAALKEEQARKEKEAENKKTSSQQQQQQTQQSGAESPQSGNEGIQKKAVKTPVSATVKKLKRKHSTKAPNSPSSPQTPRTAETPG